MRVTLLFTLLLCCAPLCAMEKPKKISNRKKAKLHKQLRRAAREGDCPVLITLLATPGIEVNAVDEQGNSALHEAVQLPEPDACQLLLGRGAQVNLQNNEGHTPLRVAAHFHLNDMISFLLAHGADIDKADITGRTPLHSIVYWATDKIVRLFIEQGAQVNTRDAAGHTPLYTVLSNIPTSRQEYARSNNGQLFYWRKNAELLLQAGARIDQESLGDQYDHWLVIDSMYKVLPHHIVHDRLDKAKALLAQGVDVNMDIKNISIRLHNTYRPLLALCKSKEMATLLLDYGADAAHYNIKGSILTLVFTNWDANWHPHRASIFLSHVPQCLLKQQTQIYIKKTALPFLLCCKRAKEGKGLPAMGQVPRDVQRIICLHGLKQHIATYQFHRATVICGMVPRGVDNAYKLTRRRYPDLAHLFDPDKLMENYRAEWQAQIANYLNGR